MAARLTRGDIILVSAPGEFGKPRPAVVVQTNYVTGFIESVIVCPLTTTIIDAPQIRPTILPDAGNGLREPSQAMADKVMAVHLRRVGGALGHLAPADLINVSRSLSFVLGLGENSV